MFEKTRAVGFGISLGIVAVAGLLLAVVATRADINRLIAVPDPVYLTLTIAGGVLGAAALLGLTILVAGSVVGRPKTWCECRAVSRRNVQPVFELMRHFFGDETPSITRMLQWQRQNKTVLTAVYLTQLTGGRKRARLVGVYKVIPLTAEAVAQVAAERKTGAMIQVRDIAKENETPAGLYIGDVAALTIKAKGEVLRQLRKSIQSQVRPGVSVYTRPLTTHGARL